MNLFNISDHIINYLAIVTFMILGVGFILAAFYLKHEMRKWNEDMEKNARLRINFAALVLSIPFLIRSTFNIIQELFLNINEDLSNSINDDTWLAPLVYFFYIFIADILPMTLQLTTMLIVIDEEDIYPTRRHSLIDKSECKSLAFLFNLKIGSISELFESNERTERTESSKLLNHLSQESLNKSSFMRIE
jgi:hypothetical protein